MEIAKMLIPAFANGPAIEVRPAPPLYMPPWRGKIADGELNDLVEYLVSLTPKGEKLDF